MSAFRLVSVSKMPSLSSHNMEKKEKSVYEFMPRNCHSLFFLTHYYGQRYTHKLLLSEMFHFAQRFEPSNLIKKNV